MSETRSSSRRKRKRAPVKLTVKLVPQKKPKIVKKVANNSDYDDQSSVDQDDHSEQDDYNEHDDEDDHAYTVTPCDFCSKLFKDRGKLLKHVRKLHHHRPLVCMCHGRVFKSRTTLLSHEEKTRDGTIGQRKNYRKYSQDTLVKAYNAVKAGKMSTRKAAKEFNIPFTTLCDRIAGRISLDKMASGPRPLLSRDDERKLCLHVSFMSAIGYTYLRQTVTQIASELAVFKGLLSEGKTLSDNWYRKFVSRFPEVAKKQKHVEKQFVAGSDIVRRYFEEYVGLLKANDLLSKPDNIYCLTVYELDMYKLSPTTEKKRCGCGKTNDMVSVILCCNASGVALDPFFVFNGALYSEKLLQGGLPNCQARVNPTGVVDSAMFKEYLKQHLLKLLKAEVGVDGPVVLVYNGHVMNFEMERIEWARKHGVLLFTLPPHTKTFKALLDVDLKRLFHQAFKQEAKRYQKKHFGDPLTRYNVCSLVSRAFPSVFVARTLAKLFKTSSVYPVAPELVDPSVTYAQVADFDYSIYDDIDSTDAFLEVKLPFPNAANRVIQRRDHLPLQSSLREILQKLPLGRNKTHSSGDAELPCNDPAIMEHSYVYGLGPSHTKPGTPEHVSVQPVIDISQAEDAHDQVSLSEVLSPTHTLISIVPGNSTQVQVVPVVETQEVSSVVEIGTTAMVSIVDLALATKLSKDEGEVVKSDIPEAEPSDIQDAEPSEVLEPKPEHNADISVKLSDKVPDTSLSKSEAVQTDPDMDEADEEDEQVDIATSVSRTKSSSQDNSSSLSDLVHQELKNDPTAKYALVLDTDTNTRYRILLSDLINQGKLQ